MINYVKCPRCDLNYIDEDKQEYCDVCLAEMRGAKLQFADLDVDEEELAEALEDDELTELCPVCGVNRMRAGEKMCDQCKAQSDEYERDDNVDPDNDEEWKNYLDEDDAEDLTVDDEELAEELDGSDDDESEESADDDDFFESEDVDSLSDLEDDEDDDDDDDDGEDDDF